MLTHIRHYSRWVLDPGRQDYITHRHTQFYYTIYRTFYTSFLSHVPLRFREPTANPMAQFLAWWRGVRRTSPSSPGIHVAPGVLLHNRHSGQTTAPPDTVRQPKKNFKPGTILVPYQCTSSLTVLPFAQLIQQHTSPSLTQSQPETHHSSSSSPPPGHMTMHMHPPLQYSNIYDLKLTSQTLYHINICTGTHHVNSTLITTIFPSPGACTLK